MQKCSEKLWSNRRRSAEIDAEVGLRTDSAIVQPPFSDFNDWTFNDGIKANNLGVVNFFTFYEHLNAYCLVCYKRRITW